MLFTLLMNYFWCIFGGHPLGNDVILFMRGEGVSKISYTSVFTKFWKFHDIERKGVVKNPIFYMTSLWTTPVESIKNLILAFKDMFSRKFQFYSSFDVIIFFIFC